MFVGYRFKVRPKADLHAMGQIELFPLSLLSFGFQDIAESKNKRNKKIIKRKAMDDEELFADLMVSFIVTMQSEFELFDVDEFIFVNKTGD